MLKDLIRRYPDAFYEELRRDATPHVRAAAFLGALAMASFAAVDATLVSGDALSHAATIRVATTATLLAILALSFLPGWASRHARAATLAACLITGGGVVAVTYFVGGGDTRYHEALYLTMFGYALLAAPWRRWDAPIAFASLLIGYDVLMAIGGVMGSTEVWVSTNALLWLGWLISVVLQALLMRARYREYEHRTQLALANDRLKELDRAKTRFFANLSHELRTPLTLILAPVEAAIEEAHARPDAPALPKLQLIRRNALRLLRLVDDLLALSRAEAASLRLRVERVDMVALARVLEGEVRTLAARKQIDFGVFIKPGLRDIQGDVHLIERVLLNLLGNAAKFTEPGGRIGLSLGPTSDGGVEVAVNDTGIGIPADALPRIFDRFFRVDDRAGVGGTGIGLSLAKEIVRLHGGEITVDSAVGVGTTFRFTLPPRPPESAPVETPDAAPAAVEGLPEWHGTLRSRHAYRLRELDDATERRVAPRQAPRAAREAPTVLIVEDNADMIRFLVAILSEEYNTLTARNGADGLRMAIERRPDLIISDVMMPEMDGLEMVRRLRLDPTASQIPVILLTARGTERDRVEGRAQGADVFLAKPFKVEELMAAIGALLDRQRQVRRAARDDRDELLVFMASGLFEALDRAVQVLNAAQCPAQVAETTVTLRSLADELRAFAEAGVGEAAVETPVAEAVRSAVASVALPDGAQPIEVSTPTTARVFFPAGQLERVVSEVVRNAVAATPPQGHVTVTAHDEPDGRVTIRVTDQGPGVPRQHAERVFFPFYDAASGRPAGLTMATCRRLVEQHGGAMFIDPAHEAGTCVVIHLPAAAAPASGDRA